MAQLSIQIQNQLSVAEKVIASAKTHGPSMSILLAARAKEVQGDGTKATVEAFEAVFSALADGLAKSNSDLRDAEMGYFAEKADDAPIRAARDAAVSDLCAMLAQLRGNIEGTLGPQDAIKYGLVGDVPRVPHKLVTYTKNVVKQLEDHPQKTTTALGASFDTAPAAAAVKNKLQALATHVDDDNREARELEQAQLKRNRAAEAWSDAYQGAATTFEGLYRAAGHAELADKVRPTLRKMRGEDPGEEVEAPPPPNP